MKLIQVTPTTSFLTWPQMSIRLTDKIIYFGFGAGIGSLSSMHEFEAQNEHVAKECYLHLVDYLTDPESAGCDLPYRHDLLVKCWELAPTLAPAMLALQGTSKTDASFADVKPIKDAYMELDPTWTYASREGVPTYYGRFVLKFHEIQSSKK